MTLDCVKSTQSNVIQIIHRNVDLKCFFNFTKMFIIVVHAYFSHVLQGSVETHLRYGGIYNNHIIANCAQSVSKNFENWSLIGKDRTKVKCHVFYGPPCICVCICVCVIMYVQMKQCQDIIYRWM